MSLGTNVVMTRGGAGDDYANDGNAVMVDAVTTIGYGEVDPDQVPIGGASHWLEARVSDLTRAIREVLTPSEVMERRVLEGYQTAAKFSWDNSAYCAEMAIASALTGDPRTDEFVRVENAVDTVLTEWTAESLCFAVGLLMERHDFHGARELITCYAPHDPFGHTNMLLEQLTEIASRQVDLWCEAAYRTHIQNVIDKLSSNSNKLLDTQGFHD
jgi:hypothetical protein